MEYLISQKEQDKIRTAIEAFETKSSAEMVTVIAKQSDSYIFIPTLWAAVAALIVPWLLFGFVDNFTHQELNIIQLIIFTFLASLGQIKKIKMFLIPSFIKKKRSANMAKEQFFKLLVQDTQNDGLVLLFVSEAEKYVEIITDATIAKKIDDTFWEETIQNFTIHVKADNIALGYLESIEQMAEPLIKYFPQTRDDKDELPNHLIMI